MPFNLRLFSLPKGSLFLNKGLPPSSFVITFGALSSSNAIRNLSLKTATNKMAPSKLNYRSFTTTKIKCIDSENSKAPGSPLPSNFQQVYLGPLAKTAKYLKLFSISSLVVTCSLSPLIFFIDAGLSTVVRTILFGAALGTSGLSTALIHWCIHPYTTRCWVDTNTLKKETFSNNDTLASSNPLSLVDKDTKFCIENLNLLGKYSYSQVTSRDLEPSTRLFTTHKFSTADGVKGMSYFHLDVAERNPILNQLFNLSSGKLDALRSTASYLEAKN